MAVLKKQQLGSGLYTVKEAALYARVSVAMMTRWLYGSKAGHPVIEPEFGPDERAVSFLDLIQTLAIREIRLQRDVPLPKFRQAIKIAKETFGLDHPFARHHCTYLFGEELVIRPSPDKDEYVEASGHHRGQRMFPFVEMYLKHLDFNPSGLAAKYRIFTSGHEAVSITMDPQTRFGEPLLPSGYTAMSIWNAIKVEGGIERAARAYGITGVEVQTAYNFVVDHLGKTAA